MAEAETESADPSPAGARVTVEIDDDPTRRSGPRRVYGSTKAPDALLTDVPAHDAHASVRMIGRALAGRYTIEAVIGRRLHGTAYRAVDGRGIAGGRPYVTLTVLDDRIARNAAAVERIRQAAGVARGLEHPAVDIPEAVVEAGGIAFLVSEYRPGRLLSGLLGQKQGAGWPLRSVLPVGYRIADALAPAHAAGLAHGALDAGSVLMTPDDGVVILGLCLGSASAERQPEPADDVLALARLVLALLSSGGAPGRAGAVPARPAGLRDAAWSGLLAGLAADASLRPATPEALMVSLDDPGWFRRLVGRRSR